MESLQRRLYELFALLTVIKPITLAWDLVERDVLDQALASPPTLVALITNTNDQKATALEVEWDKLADVAEVVKLVYQCRPGDQICSAIEASSFPIVSLYEKSDAPHIYRGPRSASEIDHFVQRMRRPAVSRVGPPNREAFKLNDHGVCLCTASPGKHQDFVTAFQTIAAKYRAEYTFGMIELDDQTAVAPVVECWRHMDSKQKAYNQQASGIEAFILEALRSTIVDLTPDNHQRLLNRQWPMVYIFGDSPSQRSALRRDLRDFASSWPDLTTVIVDPLDFPDLPAKLGLKNQQQALTFPAGAVHQLTTGRIWPYPAGKALDNKSLQQWGMDVWQGKVAPWNAKRKEGKKSEKVGQKSVKANRQIKLPNLPGLEELRKKLEQKEEL